MRSSSLERSSSRSLLAVRPDRVPKVLPGSGALKADKDVNGCAEPLERLDQDVVAGSMPDGAVKGEILLRDGEVVAIGHLLHAAQVAP